MLNWPKGYRDTDGIWSKVWYQDVIPLLLLTPKILKNILYQKLMKIFIKNV